MYQKLIKKYKTRKLFKNKKINSIKTMKRKLIKAFYQQTIKANKK